MTHHWKNIVGVCVAFAAVILASGSVTAQTVPDKAISDDLFDRGVALRKESMKLGETPGSQVLARKKLEEACAKFKESDRLHHSRSKSANLAECYASLGRVASAWPLFRALADEYKGQGDAERETLARQRAEDMKVRMPWLVIDVTPSAAGTAGIKVSRSSAPVEPTLWGEQIPVDPGDQRVEATAPGKKTWHRTVTLEEKQVVTVSVPELESAPIDLPSRARLPAQVSSPSTDAPSHLGMHPQRAGALAAGGIGGVAVLVGSVAGIWAISQSSSAKKACLTSPCNEAADTMDEAAVAAKVSNVGFIVGGAGLAAATILWVTAPSISDRRTSASLYIVPSIIGTDGGAIQLFGAF